MEITDVRIKLVNNATDRLKAFCSVTLDDEFVIRDIKLVEGASGLFVAMPSRKLSASCPECRHKNPLRAHFCNECGADLPRLDLPVDDHGRLRLYRDIAHPITPEFREKMQELIVEAYKCEQEKSVEPDYEPATGVDLDDVVDDAEDAKDAKDADDAEGADDAKDADDAEGAVDADDADDADDTDDAEGADDTNGNRSDEPSEYAALIAGLDQGGRSEGDRAPAHRHDRGHGGRKPDSSGGQRGGEQADRGERRDDSRGGQRRRGGRRRKPSGERRDGVTEPRTAPAALVSAKDDRPEKPVLDKAEAPRMERPAAAPRDEKDKVSLSAATEDTSAADSLDDTSAFGVGIL